MNQEKLKFLESPAAMREEFNCGYEIATLEDVSMNGILSRVTQAVAEAQISSDHPTVLLPRTDLRLQAALEALANLRCLVHLDSLELTVRKMIEDDKFMANKP
jgi:hypothetical protein